MRVKDGSTSRRRLIGGALTGAAALLAACGPLPVPGAEQPTAAPKAESKPAPAAASAAGASTPASTTATTTSPAA